MRVRDAALGELQQIIDALEEANLEDVAELASQAIGILQELGGTVPDDDGQDASEEDELEAKALALSIRMKMLR